MIMDYRYECLPELESNQTRKRIVVLTGAGVSVESGLPTYRSDDFALYVENDCINLATPYGFRKNPAAVLDFYNRRRLQLAHAQPNHAHRLLAELEKWHDVTIITQNVDDLHERAGSTDVIHVHGELTKVTSSVSRTDPACIRELPLDVPMKIGDTAADGSQIRPNVVWFGEEVYAYEKSRRIACEADVFGVIGTSLKVTPAADLVKCPIRATMKYIIDPCEPFDPCDDNYPEGYEHIRAKATVGMEILIDRLMEFE
jgi:NAD-dependent deacetylase